MLQQTTVAALKNETAAGDLSKQVKVKVIMNLFSS
jgi:hypothetical protein